jgi:CBS domain-containing protein
MATTARDAMTKDVITVRPDTPLTDVARMFSEDKISGAPVVDSNDRLVGIVSRTDVITGLLDSRGETKAPAMRWLLGIGDSEEAETEDGGDLPEPEGTTCPIVEDVMDGDPTTVAPDASLDRVARHMARERLHRVVVLENHRVAGILTSIDLLAHFPTPTSDAPSARRPALVATTATATSAKAAGAKAKAKKADRPKAKPAKRPVATRRR